MQIVENAVYNVRLTRPVTIGPFTYRPLHEIEMSAAVLKSIVEAHGEEVIDYARPL